MKIEDLIGKIIWNYDKGKSSTILDDGRWKSDVEYDDECEENYIITDIVKTTDEFIIMGKLMNRYDDALDAYHIEEIKHIEPIGLFGIDDISNLLEKSWCMGKELTRPIIKGKITRIYNPIDRVLRWDLYNGTPMEFFNSYEEDDN